MKKSHWLAAKVAFVSLGLVLIYGLDLHNVSAQDRTDCNTTQACTGWFWCDCGDSDCGGCYTPNGQGGCGTCANAQ